MENLFQGSHPVVPSTNLDIPDAEELHALEFRWFLWSPCWGSGPGLDSGNSKMSETQEQIPIPRVRWAGHIGMQESPAWRNSSGEESWRRQYGTT